MKIFLIQPKGKGAFRAPPLGLQIIATVLKKYKYDNIYDIDPEKGDDPYSLDYLGDDVLVGMTVTFMTISEAFKLAKFIKSKNHKVKVIFGGPQVTLMSEESINDESVDIAVIGEGTYTMLEIVDRIKDRKTLEGVKGIWYKNESKEIVKNEPREFIRELDSLPYADKSFFNERQYQKYQQAIFEKLIYSGVSWYIMSSQSCPFNCKMCQPALRKIAGPWRQRSVSNVINEIKSLKVKYKAKKFCFNDNDMGIDRKWMEEFCQEAKKIKNISMTCCGRANLLDYEMLKLMKEAGFNSISFGAESGSDRVLRDIMNKKTSVSNIIDFANNCYKLRIKASAFWMLASPGETIEEMKETVKLASELPIYYCHFHIANPNPGTQYYIDALHDGYLNMKSWDDIHDRKTPTIIKNNVTVNDIITMDEYLIKTMVGKGWNYRHNGHTLLFFNTRLFVKWQPVNILGREIMMFFNDFKMYHFRNIFLGVKFLLGFDRLI